MKPVYRRIGRYKYILIAPYRINIGILDYRIDTKFIALTPGGILTIKDWYAWNGANVVRDKDAIRASLVHDALYQLIAEGLIGRNYRPLADRIYRRILEEDNAPRWRSRLHYWGLRLVWTPLDAIKGALK